MRTAARLTKGGLLEWGSDGRTREGPYSPQQVD